MHQTYFFFLRRLREFVADVAGAAGLWLFPVLLLFCWGCSVADGLVVDLLFPPPIVPNAFCSCFVVHQYLSLIWEWIQYKLVIAIRLRLMNDNKREVVNGFLQELQAKR